ncbi:hypothetical protein AK88_01435 [Plasmodium fragile]|uniref:Obg domain-containing protein n=1 Tax=Plasmodium fragile TaxID=5857 RepID=A0A0D9QTF8_PLAFR|nr:uncharacterized protein AK88_01435 [Plasmodium fragile]KJP88941.1 hypothetical protein AK88_01435 [Plasmodium fragile]
MRALWLPTNGRRLYSIKIVDKVTKKSVKIYEHSLFGRNGKGKKFNESCPHDDGESTFPTDEGCTSVQNQRGAPIVGVKSDVCKVARGKTSIFYESERIIKCESGAGGDGAISFKKFKRKVLGSMGIPNGGKGGNGGNVYLCYWDPKGGGPLATKRKRRGEDKHVYVNNLAELPCVISATNGSKGKANQLRGKNGMSVFLHFNKMCHVYRLFPRGQEEEGTCGGVADSKCTHEPLHMLRGHRYDTRGTPLGDEQRDVLMVGTNNQLPTPHVKEHHDNLLTYKSQYEDKVYKVIKKEDPVYVKKNMHILKQLIRMDKEVGREIYIGMLSPNNNSLLLSKGGEGGKGNNMKDTYTYGKGAKGTTSYIKIVYSCISDTCFLGFAGSGKSTLLSLIAPKIHTVNNLYVLKKIFFKDNFQVSVADFSGDCTEDGRGISDGSLIAEQIPPFRISSNVAQHLELVHLFVIVLDMHRELMPQFRAIREELCCKDERLFHKPYIVVINKCDVHFTEKIKRAEEAYRDIKAYGGEDVPVFFISAKYAMGIDKFVTHLRTCVQKLKHAKC